MKAATSAGMRIAHEERSPYNPDVSLALAFGVPRITHFNDHLQNSHPSSRPPPSCPIIVEFAQYYSVEDLNITGYTDETGAEVVVTTS